MDTLHSRDGPGTRKRGRGSFAGPSSTPDQPPARDPAVFYPIASSNASQFAAGAESASEVGQGYGQDAPAPGGLGSEDTDGLADGFPPDDGSVLWQGDLGVQGRFRTRVRVIGLEDGGQRAHLLRDLVFRPSPPVQEDHPDLAA